MWVIKNEITKAFFAGWDEKRGVVQTTDSKIYASHFSSWDAAAKEIKILSGHWKPVPKEEA